MQFYAKEAASPRNYSNEMKYIDLKYTQIFEMFVNIYRSIFSLLISSHRNN